MRSMDSNDGKDCGWADIGGRYSSVSKLGCGDVGGLLIYEST